MTDEPMPPPPREPEIEFLGKVAHVVLRLIRVVLFTAGAYSIASGIAQMTGPHEDPEGFLKFLLIPSATGTIWLWFTLGLMLVVPSKWIFTKGPAPWALLAVNALLWFVPMALGDDSRYGYILRMFASLIAFLTMLVWRTLWRLTEPDDGNR